MTEREWPLERLFEAYRDRAKATGRLVTVTLVFAGLALWKVFVPLSTVTEEIAHARIAEASTLAEAESLEVEAFEAEAAREQLDAVQPSHIATRLAEASAELREELSELSAARVVLTEATSEPIEPTLLDAGAVEALMSRGGVATDTTRAVSRQVSTQKLGFRKLAFDEWNRSDAMGRAQLIDERATLAEAERGRATVKRVADWVRSDVLADLEAVRQSASNIEALAELGPRLEEIRSSINDWEKKLSQQTEWLEEDDKLEVDRIQTELVAWGDKCQTWMVDVKAQMAKSLADRRSEIQVRLERHRAAVQAGESRRESLDGSLRSILPTWTRGLVTPAEMIQLFPWVSILLILWVTHQATTLRRQSLAFERELVRNGFDGSMPTRSLWTPRQRPARGTLWTTVAWSAAMLSFGACGVYAHRELKRWSDSAGEGVWTWTEGTLALSQWLPIVALLAAAVLFARTIRIPETPSGKTE